MSWLLSKRANTDDENYLDFTRVVVLVTDAGGVARIFKRGKREHYVHGDDLKHFDLTGRIRA